MAKRENIWNLPNVLTMIRMALIGVFIWQFVVGHMYWAMAVFVLAGITDFLDGYFARKNQQVTNFGKLMDPLADKLMLITALTCLTVAGLVPIWVVVVVFVKELLMIIGGYMLLKRGVVVQSMFVGKAATVLFIVAVVATFLHEYLAPWHLVLQYYAVGLSVFAMLWYFINTIKAIRAKRNA